MWRTPLVALVSILLYGCATAVPYDPDSFRGQIARDLQIDPNNILVQKQVSYAIVSNPDALKADFQKGVYVQTTDYSGVFLYRSVASVQDRLTYFTIPLQHIAGAS